MTRQADIERLARFMGWEFYVDSQLGVVYGVRGSARQFDPFTRLDDAMMVAEKIVGTGTGMKAQTFSLEKMSMWKAHEAWCARFQFEGIIKFGASAAEAIALAALAYLDAVGFK